MKVKLNYNVTVEVVDETNTMTLGEIETMVAKDIQGRMKDSPCAFYSITECNVTPQHEKAVG